MGGLTEKQLTIISLAGGLVITAVIGVLCYLEHDKIQQTKEKTAGLAKQLDGYNRKIAKIPALTKEIRTLQQTFAVYRDLLPTGEQEIERFYDQIELWRRELGIQAFAIKPDKGDIPEIWPEEAKKKKKGGARAAVPARTGPQDYVMHPRFFGMEVNFWQLGQFLNYIENWSRLAIVTDLTISTENKYKAGDIKLKVGFSLKSFFYIGPELPEEIRDDDAFKALEKQEVTPEIREMVFKKPFVWNLKGTDNWFRREGGGRPGGKGPEALARNPFDPYPALTLKADEDTEFVEGLERLLATLKQKHQEKVGKQVVLQLVENLKQKAATREPAGEDARRRWNKVKQEYLKIEQEYLTPELAAKVELDRVVGLEQRLAGIKSDTKGGNFVFKQIDLRLAKLEKDAEAPVRSEPAKTRLQAVRDEIPRIRSELSEKDAGAALAKAKKLLKQIEEHFAKQQYGSITEPAGKIGRHAESWPTSTELQEIHKQARRFRDRAQVLEQAAKFKLQITGVFDITGGPKFAFINGSRYTVGDMIQVEGKQIKIVGIKAAREDREMMVTFEFEGEQFSRARKL